MNPKPGWILLAALTLGSVSCALLEPDEPSVEVRRVTAAVSASATASATLSWCLSQPAAWPGTAQEISDGLSSTSSTVRDCAIWRLTGDICENDPAMLAGLNNILSNISANHPDIATQDRASDLLLLFAPPPIIAFNGFDPIGYSASHNWWAVTVDVFGGNMTDCSLLVADDLDGSPAEPLLQTTMVPDPPKDACQRGATEVSEVFPCPAGASVIVQVTCRSSDTRTTSDSTTYTCPAAPSPSPTGT